MAARSRSRSRSREAAGSAAATAAPAAAASPPTAVRRRVCGKRPPTAAEVKAHPVSRETTAATARGDSRASLPLRTLVINLDRRQDRWRAVKAVLAPLETAGLLTVTRLPATDGLQSGGEVADADVGREWTTDRNSKYDGRQGARAGVKLQLTPGERGCAMSHVRAWRHVAESEVPVLVLEDDAKLLPRFAARLPGLVRSAAAAGADLLYLGYIQGAPWRRKVAKGLQEAEYLWTTVSYVLWPCGARRLLALLPVDQPVDNFMAWQMASRRLLGLACVPEIVDQAEEWDKGSDVPHSDDLQFEG
eukprot:TRINITY_DN6302_c1_g1_i1.p1 TRINITY_DN6302_c1_g1~~TRINITY_DN6302_c1_g1_i1.p1  ORF type:complete len:325 (-),score=75.87 TRINITY_DN6302_c1_g1_i1:100-1011(-)